MSLPETDVTNIHVLHVDDDPAFTELVATFLRQINDHMRVSTAASVDEALSMLERNAVDCIVSDYDMPPTDGLTFLEAVRQTDPELPFILFTGKGSEEIASEAISAGVTDYLQKQSGTDQYDVLANRIQNAVEKYRAKQRATEVGNELRQIYGRITDAVVAFDADMCYTYVNDEAERILEYTEDELLGQQLWEVFPELEESEFRAVLETALDTQETASAEGYLSQIDSWVNARIFPDEGGVSIYFRDITTKKESERELEFFNELVDEVGIGIGAYNENGRISYVNEAYASIVDRSPDEVIGTPIWELNPEFDAERFDEYWDSYAESETRVRETMHRRSDGSTVPVEVVTTSRTIQGTQYHFGTIRDISDRYEESRLLRQYETLVEGMDESVFMFDTDGICTLVNRATVEHSGYTRDELIGGPISRTLDVDIIQGEDKQREYIDTVRRLLNGDIAEEQITVRVALETMAEPVVTDVRLTRVDDADGDVLGVVGVAHDVTDRHERERDLAARTAAMEATTDGIAIHDSEGRYTYVNRALVTMYGYDDRQTFYNQPFKAYYTTAVHDRIDEELFPALEASGNWRGELTGRRNDGSTFPIEVSVTTLDDGRLVSVVRDVTSRKRRQHQLERRTKQLTEFASVVSHDLRNPLATAKGYLELARDTGNHSYFEEISFSLDRMERIIGNLLWLAREGQQIDETDELALADALIDAWSVVATDSMDTTLEFDRDELGAVTADYDRLCHLFENILGNAVEHATESVTISVESTPNGFAIEDDGPGIPPSERECVFERGYTTRNHGTGLGLHIVKNIVEAHDWEITLKSASDGGARFEIVTECDAKPQTRDHPTETERVDNGQSSEVETESLNED